MIAEISLPLFLIVLSGLFFAYFMDKYLASKERCQKYGLYCGYMKFAAAAYVFLVMGAFMFWSILYPEPITMWGDVLAYSSALILFPAAFSRPRTKKGFVWWVSLISICRTTGVVGFVLVFAVSYLF